LPCWFSFVVVFLPVVNISLFLLLSFFILLLLLLLLFNSPTPQLCSQVWKICL
jgi:hypothetical protein